MHNLRDVLDQAQKRGVAVGHFNVADLVLLKAVFEAAQELSVPLLVGVSEGERRFMGLRQIAALVRSLRDEFDFPIFMNADHTHALSDAVEAAKVGFDLIVFDASALPFEQNVSKTKLAVQAIKEINPDILVEGELGDIGTGSQIHEQAPAQSRALTAPADANAFVESTGIDLLSPTVGTMHGMLKSMVHGHSKKRLDIARIAEIKRTARVPLTLHGGSGTDDEDLRNAVAAGITVVHINTELRVEWRHSLEKALSKHAEEVVPYKILQLPVDSVKRVALSRLRLFNNLR